MKTLNNISINNETLNQTLAIIADQLIQSAHAIHQENKYASHITNEQKLHFLNERINLANEVKLGKHNHAFWLNQRITHLLTGEEIAFLT